MLILAAAIQRFRDFYEVGLTFLDEERCAIAMRMTVCTRFARDYCYINMWGILPARLAVLASLTAQEVLVSVFPMPEIIPLWPFTISTWEST